MTTVQDLIEYLQTLDPTTRIYSRTGINSLEDFDVQDIIPMYLEEAGYESRVLEYKPAIVLRAE